MGRECELSSPQNKLKDILHTILKRNDQQVAGDVLTAQNCQEHEPTTSAAPDAVSATADAAASPTGACAEVSPQQQQDEQLVYGNHTQRDSSAALDADGGPATIAQAAAAAAATTAEYGVAVPLEQQAQLQVSSTTAAAAGATPATQLHHAPATAHEAWDRQPTVLGQPQAHACMSPSVGRTIMAVAGSAQHEHSGPQEPPPLQSDLRITTVLQERSTVLLAAAVGQEQSAPAQHSFPASQVPLSTAAPAAHPRASMTSEPGHSSSKVAAQRKMLCASVDDLYQELFGDVPLPSTSACSSAAHSPYSAALVRGVSSMSPMTTSSAFCHQQVAAAAIAGNGGMPGMGLIPVGPPMPSCGNSNSLCSSYDGTCSNYGYNADSTCGEYAASSIVTQAAARTPGVDDMLPAGAYPPRVRVHQPSRFSGSDGGSSSLFPEESPSYCSSSAGGQAWPVASTDEPSAGVSDLSSAHGWGSRGSLRYSSPHEHSSAAGAGREADLSPQAPARRQAAQGADTKQQPGVLSAPGSAEGSKPGPRSSLRTRWTNWINGGGSSSGGSSPAGRSSGQQLTLQQEDHVGQQQQQQQQQASIAIGATSAPWLLHSKPSSPQRSSLAAHSAPGNAAAQALYNSTGGMASRGGADLPLHQLVHCHSNPELVQAAATGSVGHGRPHYQRSSGLGGGGSGGGPPCARALFGSMPQMERPLMAAHSLGNSSSNNSSGWLSGPGGVSFGAPARSESFGVLAALTACDDALSVASDDEVIRQVNADNVLSSTWGPASHSTAGGAAAGGGSGPQAGPASHPKLLAFKYCCATSPLNHPGRTSPFGSARGSPFNSPRGARDTGVVDLLPLRSSIAAAAAAAAAAASSCPGSPLGPRQSNPFSSSSSTPAAGGAAAEDGVGRAGADAALQAGSAGIAEQRRQQQEDHEAQRLADGTQHSSVPNILVLKKQPSTSSSIDQTPSGDGLSGADPCYSCNSSSGGGSTSSSSKPPLQNRPMKGFLRTPPPPLPLPVPAVPAAAQSPYLMAASPMQQQQQHRCLTMDAAGSAGSSSGGGCSRGGSSHPQLSRSSTGPTGSQSATATGGGGYARRISAPAGLSALVMRFSSNSGSSSSSTNPAPHGGGSSIGGRGSQDLLLKTGQGAAAAAEGPTDSQTLSDPELLCIAAGSSHGSSGRAVGVPPPLPSCSIDAGSPRQLLPAAADSRSSPRRQSSSRWGASCGFTTPSRLSHNSTMGEALLAASAGGGPVSGGGGFALQRTSSCCSSSGGWAGGGGSGSSSCPGGRSSNGYVANATPGRDSLLSTTSVPLTHAYGRDTAGVNCSDSSDGSWTAGAAARRPADEQQQQQQQQQQEEGVSWPVATDSSGVMASMTARTAASGAANRYGSCNGASEVSMDCQECPYPSWCSSSCLSPLAPPPQQQQVQTQVPATQQQQQQQQQMERGSPQRLLASASLVGEAADGTVAVSAAAGAAAAGSAAPPSLPEVDFLEKIGRGSFGDVFKGVWCGSVVAIKVIQVKQPSALTFPNRPPTNQQQRRTNDEQISQQGLRSHPLGDAAAAHGATSEYDSQAAQVALELAQHEYESWLNANLRHPNIVQLFTSFTLGLEERSHMVMPSLLLGSAGGDDGDDASSPRSSFPLMQDAQSSGMSWKTHLVMEFCELGTMQDLLQRGVFSQGLHSSAACPSSSHLSWVLATAKEFCTAVSYLHSMDVVHGDLKSSNVLLKAAALTSWDTRGFVAKVSDFGLSRVMDAISAANGEPPSTPPATGMQSPAATGDAGDTDAGSAAAEASGAAAAGGASGACSSSSSSTGGGGEGGGPVAGAGGGSLGWQPCQHRFGALSHAAPELIQGAQLSKASDVYSIGVLLWELLTGQAPFYGMHPGQLLSLKLSQHTSQLLPFPPSTPSGMAQLCLDCWTAEPLERPSMAAVVQRINDLAVTLLGQEQAVAMFPDVAASLAAQRRQAAVALSSSFGASCN